MFTIWAIAKLYFHMLCVTLLILLGENKEFDGSVKFIIALILGITDLMNCLWLYEDLVKHRTVPSEIVVKHLETSEIADTSG